MTHSIIFEIRMKEWDRANEIKETIKASEEFIELYQLRKSKFCYEQKDGSQPFIYFPDKDENEDGYYKIVIETGSHVGPEDELYALHWYYFTLAFRKYFKEELKGLKMGYRLDGETDLNSDDWIKKEIYKMKKKPKEGTPFVVAMALSRQTEHWIKEAWEWMNRTKKGREWWLRLKDEDRKELEAG